MPDIMVEFVCTGCGKKEKRPKYCPYTGMLHGTGFRYVCTECRSDMVIVVEPETPKHVSECERVLNVMKGGFMFPRPDRNPFEH